MTSRAVIVALQRSMSKPSAPSLFARLADVVLALALFVLWFLALPGCSMDTSGLSTSLRGEIAVDSGSEVATSDAEVATAPDAVPTTPDSGGMAGNSGSVMSDGGSTDSDQNAGSEVDSGGTDVLLPPSPCASNPTLSLSPCDHTTALCRTYDTPGHAVLETNCTAEGYVCVDKCPT